MSALTFLFTTYTNCSGLVIIMVNTSGNNAGASLGQKVR